MAGKKKLDLEVVHTRLIREIAERCSSDADLSEMSVADLLKVESIIQKRVTGTTAPQTDEMTPQQILEYLSAALKLSVADLAQRLVPLKPSQAHLKAPTPSPEKVPEPAPEAPEPAKAPGEGDDSPVRQGEGCPPA